MKSYLTVILLVVLNIDVMIAQNPPSVEGNVNNLPVREYTINISQEVVDIGGKEKIGMTINGSIPGPTLKFTEGEYAVIHVKNDMDVETSIHWHGLLLPNFFDGVPYLTTPPIKAGETFTYEFALKQAGTYWYHSHTGLQEQDGVYGSFVIDDPEEDLEYDADLVLVLADWTFEKPTEVLRTLKRGSEWYGIKKNTVVPLAEAISKGALGAQLNFWRQRMEGVDISDVYYPAFLTNGATSRSYPAFQPGDKVRLRFINASASTQFWLTFGGENDALLVAADGLDVVPVERNKTFIAVAETYDFIVAIPQNGQLEVRATAQDGTGHTSAFLGKGESISAPDDLPRPDLVKMMKEMAAMDMKMGAPAMKFRPGKEESEKLMAKYGMKMDEMQGMDQGKMDQGKMDHGKMDHGKMDHSQYASDTIKSRDMDSGEMDHQNHQNKKGASGNNGSKMPMEGMDSGMEMNDMNMFSEFNYDYLQAQERTAFSSEQPVREILLNLTGNMQRYIWSMNGVPLSEGDKIKIKQGEVTRITLNNLTMMHHPMHLHGHFFRVLNENGEYSPLKHTVNVAPMQKIVIEFDANEYGDWFFHCHILYHMDSGMARIYSYGTPRDLRLEDHPLKILTNKSNDYFTWGMVDVASHMAEFNAISSNIRNQFTLSGEYGWNKNLEAELTYERYLNDWFRVFGGINLENEEHDTLEEISSTAIAGIRYFTPYMFNLDLRMDNKLRPQISLSREILVFRRIAVFVEYELQGDFGWVNELPESEKFRKEEVFQIGAEYFLSKNFSFMASYDNRFGAGGGLSARF